MRKTKIKAPPYPTFSQAQHHSQPFYLSCPCPGGTGKVGNGSYSQYNPFYRTFSSCFSPAPLWVLHRLQFLQEISSCSNVRSSTGCSVNNCNLCAAGKYLLWCLEHLPPLLL